MFVTHINGRIPSILVVDDDHIHCRYMESTLSAGYSVKCIHSVPEAISHLQSAEAPPDIILLDFNLPQADGRQLLYAINDKRDAETIPIIFVTTEADPELQEQLLGLGAVDYMQKPVQPGILKRKITNHVRNHRQRSALHSHNQMLHEELADAISELQLVQDVTILALATLTEVRNSETGEHIWRTQEYVKVLAHSLQHKAPYRGILTDRDVYLMYKTAPLHDIGKVGIPDDILNKPSALTAEEIEVIKSHTLIGFNALTQAERLYENTENSFLKYAREICCSHHERWDGTGYPHGLKGEEIPLSARVMAIADVYDALVTQRVYKRAMGHDEAVDYISRQRERAFDPNLVEVFIENHMEFKAIATSSAAQPRPVTLMPY